MAVPSISLDNCIITGLYIYPVKSLSGIPVNSFQLTDRGPEFDRRWMLADTKGCFVTQREHPQMALLGTAIKDDQLVLFDRNQPTNCFSLPLVPDNGTDVEVSIWEDTCTAWHPSPEASQWISQLLKMDLKLVYMPDHAHRPVDADYSRNADLTSFSDGYPLLIIGQPSLDDLNRRLSQPVQMERFRPNIVFSGGEPYLEDHLKHFSIGSTRFYGVKPCARCVLTTIDPMTAKTSQEPLKTLSAYRTRNNKVMFGMNLLYEGKGGIQLGDLLKMS